MCVCIYICICICMCVYMRVAIKHENIFALTLMRDEIKFAKAIKFVSVRLLAKCHCWPWDAALTQQLCSVCSQQTK